MSAFRSRLLVLLTVVGLIMPTLPVNGKVCQHEPGSVSACGADEEPVSSCCMADSEEPQERADQDCNDSSGCDCSCCSSATASPVLHRLPSAAAVIAPRPRAMPVPSQALRPQAAVIELLRPPQS